MDFGLYTACQWCRDLWSTSTCDFQLTKQPTRPISQQTCLWDETTDQGSWSGPVTAELAQTTPNSPNGRAQVVVSESFIYTRIGCIVLLRQWTI